MSDGRPRLLQVRNGPKEAGLFSAAEMAARIARLRGHMAEAALDAVLFTSIPNVDYYSGYVYCSFGRAYGLVVTPEEATNIAAAIDAGQPFRRSHHRSLSYTDWWHGGFYAAVQALAKGAGRLGVELDHLTVAGKQALCEALPGIDLVDVAPWAMATRMFKSPEELALIRQGARIADLGGEACLEAIGPGVAEFEVAHYATARMVREIAATYPRAELRDTWCWLQSGINTDGAHNPLTARRLRPGDCLSLNCFPMIGGYYTALERTLFLGSVTEAERRLWEVNCEVHRRGIERIRPGLRCCDIAAELNEIYARHGLLEYRTFGYGHSFGILCHYYGREAGLELREDVETELAPGMVVSMEPMIAVPEGREGAGGYREHDILIVTEDGAEDITAFPFGPEHNIVPI